MKRTQTAYYRGFRAAIIAILGGKCRRCPIRDTRLLQIDHVMGGGNQHREQHGRAAYLRSIARLIGTPAGRKKFRLLCANHNVLAHQSRNTSQSKKRT